jgi:2,3-bisphosphoglycerate-independent phosphoglycerate mutase
MNKLALIILDGWGINPNPAISAIEAATTPVVDHLLQTQPNATLTTFGEEVGLPEGQMGNSEVGHINIGAGRVVYQELARINKAFRENELLSNKVFCDAIEFAKSNTKKIHLLGLVSDGGVHSHIDHVKALTSLCAGEGLKDVYVHAFTDGRDTDPKSGLGFLTDLQNHLTQTTGNIATVTGRYYAMDRDKRWERVKIAYDALVNGNGENVDDLLAAVKRSYDNGVTDEFIKPIINKTLPNVNIQNDDVVICFNFRTDRCREITEVLTQANMPEFGMHTLNLHYTTMTQYDHKFKNVNVVFENDDLRNTLGEILEQNGKTQIRIAETEKYPHVSFFFSGGREVPFKGESRIMIPSPKVATYDLQPEMSAVEVTEAIVKEINNKSADFICLNYANADMVGHTGVWDAIIKAVETVDKCVNKVVTAALNNGYTIFLTADHGNADYAINEDGTPNTAHTLNLVPFFIIDTTWKGNIKPGKLGDIAPTILTMMNLPVPKEMTGDILIDKN